MVKKKVAENNEKKDKKEETIDIDSLKEELNKYIDESIKRNFNYELEKSYKRTIRDKNLKILIKNIVITVLLLIIVYLVYILNANNYFDKFFVEENAKNNTEVIPKKDNNTPKVEDEKEEPKEPTLDDLKKEYAHLLDNIYINENSKYLKDYYDGNLTNELKEYLSTNLIDIDSLTVEDNYNVIESDTLKQCFDKKFIGEFTNKTFDYNDNIFRYISKIDSYITDKIINKNDTNIVKVITDIKIDNSNILITTTEGLVKDNKIYNIISNDEVSDYSPDLMIENTDKLNKLTYIFNKDNKLEKIEK